MCQLVYTHWGRIWRFTYLPAEIRVRTSSLIADSVGGADLSPSCWALMIHDMTSCGSPSVPSAFCRRSAWRLVFSWLRAPAGKAFEPTGGPWDNTQHIHQPWESRDNPSCGHGPVQPIDCRVLEPRPVV